MTSAPWPIKATPSPGLVVLVVDPSTARDIADALELTAALDVGPVEQAHLSEIEDIRAAAADADRQGADPRVVNVPLYRIPQLRLVGGDPA